MNTIIKNYNLLVNRYQKIEVGLSENEIHDKRVILRRIFPMLAAYKMKPSKVKNGEKAFKLFGKLRDIQVQILKLESIERTPEIIEYLAFLKESESKLKEKVSKFCKKKELEFPTLNKKQNVDKFKIYNKADKSLTDLIEQIESRSIDDAEDVHKIRIKFKKFRYKVEILSYIENIEEANLEMLKMYQDKLGEIQDYEVLIKGIKKYYKKSKLDIEETTEIFENDQNSLIENFDNGIEIFIAVCRDVISLNVLRLDVNIETVSSTQDEDTNESDNLNTDDKPIENDHISDNKDIIALADNKVSEKINLLGSTDDNVNETNKAEIALDNQQSENNDEVNLIEDQNNVKYNPIGSTADKESDEVNKVKDVKHKSRNRKSFDKDAHLNKDLHN